MATKKKTEEVAEVEVKEEKTTTKKSTSTKKTTSTKKAAVEVKAEEPKVEEVKEEVKAVEPAPVVEPIPETVVEPIVEEKPEVKSEVKVEKKEEPVKVEAKKVETADKSDAPFTVEVITPIGIYTKTAPSMDAPAFKVMPFKSRLVVVDQKGNWGRLTNGKWILLSENLVRKI